MKISERLDQLRLRANVWARERKEKLAERAAANAEPPGVTIPLSLVKSAKLASWMAYFCLVYFLWLYTLDIARDRAGALQITHAGQWVGELFFYFPYIVGFAMVAVGIPYVAKIAIPTFMSLRWRGEFWAKAWALFIASAVSLVVIAGTFTVQGDTILERDRQSVVAVDQVAQEAAVQQARIDDTQHRLDEMTRSPSIYVQTAASMSPAAYEAWMEARRGDWQYERFVAYRQTSIDAQRLRDEISAMRAAQARQTVASQVQGRVTTTSNGWIADTLAWLEGARAMLLSFVMDIVCLIMPWIALRLEQARNRQVGVAEGIAPHPWMLKDQRAEGNVTRERQKQDAFDVAEAVIAGGGDPRWAADMARSATQARAPNTRVTDGETGEELVQVKPHWRKLKRGQRHKVETSGEEPKPDETGAAHDGGGRAASVGDGEVKSAAPAEQNQPEASDVRVTHEPFSFSEDELAALQDASEPAPELPIEPPHAEEQHSEEGEPDQQSEHLAPLKSDGSIDEPQDEPEREPETDPRRLIAAE